MILVIKRFDLAVDQDAQRLRLGNSAEVFQFHYRVIAGMDLVLNVVDGDGDVVRTGIAALPGGTGLFAFRVCCVLHVFRLLFRDGRFRDHFRSVPLNVTGTVFVLHVERQ